MMDLIYGDLTRQIIAAAFEVFKVLGYGFLEKVYENALVEELKLRQLTVQQQHPIKVLYKGMVVGGYFADVFVEENVVVELKAEREYNERHEAQLLNYLKATGVKVGLLLNFGENKCEHKRLIF
mgnify:CR=1 FL=1